VGKSAQQLSREGRMLQEKGRGLNSRSKEGKSKCQTPRQVQEIVRYTPDSLEGVERPGSWNLPERDLDFQSKECTFYSVESEEL
jgi:hypothetical protein